MTAADRYIWDEGSIRIEGKESLVNKDGVGDSSSFGPRVKPSPFRKRTKDLSAYSETAGGALVPPPRQRKKRRTEGAKGSYFEECERDDEGHCLPSGQAGGGEDSPQKDVTSITSEAVSEGLAGKIELTGMDSAEAGGVVRALRSALTVGGRSLILRSVQVVEKMPVKGDAGGLGYSNGNIYISTSFLESARSNNREAVRRSLEGSGGERNYVWQDGDSPGEAVALAVAHEVGHHVATALLLDPAKGVRDTRDSGGKLDEDEMVKVSGYASTHPEELFAEVHALVSMGKESELPSVIRQFYQNALKTADPEPIDIFLRPKKGSGTKPVEEGKAVAPPTVPPSPFRKGLSGYSAKGSYFSECERDDEGRCLPSGEAGQQKPEGEQKPQTPREAWEARDKARYEQRGALEEAAAAAQNVQQIKDADEILETLHADLEVGNVPVAEMDGPLQEVTAGYRAYWDQVGRALRAAGVGDRERLKLDRVLARGEAAVAKATEKYRAQAERSARQLAHHEELTGREPAPDDPGYDAWAEAAEKAEERLTQERDKFTERYDELLGAITDGYEEAYGVMEEVVERAGEKLDAEEEADPEPEEEDEEEKDEGPAMPAVPPSPFRKRPE